MHPFAHLRLLTDRRDFQSPELQLCAVGWPTTALIGTPALEKVRRGLGLHLRASDTYVRSALHCLRETEACLEQQGIPAMDEYPAPLGYPGVAQIQGGQFLPDSSRPPAAIGPDIYPAPEFVDVSYAAEDQARIDLPGTPGEVVLARFANSVLTVAWPSWLRVRGLILPDAPWLPGSRIRVRFAPSQVSTKAQDAHLSSLRETRELLAATDLEDLHFAASAPDYRVGYVAAAVVIQTYLLNKVSLE